MLEKLKKKLLDIAGRCDYADACPYFDEDSYTCMREIRMGKRWCGKYRKFEKKSELQIIKEIVRK